jgi:hypothetical protein
MVIFELTTKEAQQTFKEIKKILTAAKTWKITTRIEITVLDGKIQLVGLGFVKELNALTTGSCKLVVPVLHWFELVTMSTDKILKVVVTEGEAMVGKVSVRVLTTFFETDKILRSISLPANPKAIDYWKLEYQGYIPEEIQFNGLESKISWAKREFEECIDLAAMNLNPFRITKAELREMILNRIWEKEKMEFKIK